ncbi:3-hydroxybenzoate 6-monooxygenase [Kutzneria sp. CA-103260]|uniref:3-hydroxybenzoate 6-monooxygenase n=1 Tax=Kutzneria sp. CA-103260 TaxID=2802641 RepID=UPI001BAC3703|nr:3-hydroxybenzoate 6-monooxygenase [Kutzneria sp. CA-103260]QUQ64456.1 3-hydroxybenzoate 6-hydroxylase 1 [Kutzneria sp. CA-103260]
MAEIIIAGGGIGGLACALAVAARGHQVVVLERAAEFAELGAGIQLAPNAFHALDQLGVGEAVRRRAVNVDHLELMDGVTGGLLARLPLGEDYQRRFGNLYAVVHRGDLYAPLLAACQQHDHIRLRSASAVVGYEANDAAVTCVLASGETVRGDGLVGADGIRSVVRRQLVGDGEPRVSGHTIYRSVVPMDQVPPWLRSNSVTLWAGPRWHMVRYPIADGRSLNLAITRDDGATTAVAGRPVDRNQVLSRFPELADVPRGLLEHGLDWRQWVLCDRDPIRRWAKGRVVLMGDAAHPMLQYAAQGACMALEDAVLLGALLDCAADQLPERFVRFNALRGERTARIQGVSRQIGEHIYHPAGAQAQARNLTVASMSVDDLYDRVSWLHGYRVVDGVAL